MRFRYEAMTRGGAIEMSQIEAAAPDAALDMLREQGLLPLKIAAADEGDAPRAAARPRPWSRPGARDLLLFTRQMKMLLEAGSSVVTALQACENQVRKATFRDVLRAVRERVENGGTLTDALRDHPRLFRPTFCSMVAAGEATATLGKSFGRLSELTYRQEQVRKTVIGALVYPSVLSVLCTGVVALLIGFVVPRFKMLFINLKHEMPFSTKVMFAASDTLHEIWPYLVLGLIGSVTGIVFALRSRRVREALDPALLRVPLLGSLLKRLEFARVLRIWAAMLKSNVQLLETIEHSRGAAGNIAYCRLLDALHERISVGERIGEQLRTSGLVDPVIASAISTGEENGRLAEACEFVSAWMDDDNSQAITALTRVAEPVMLSLMGLFVGIVAMGLFLPLFDMAAA